MLNLSEKYWNWQEFNKGYMKYRVLGLLGFGGILRNVCGDTKAGKVFIEGHKSGIESVKKDHYNMTVEFNNGTKFQIWIANKMYSYGSGSYSTSEYALTHINGLLPKWVNLVALQIENNH